MTHSGHRSNPTQETGTRGSGGTRGARAARSLRAGCLRALLALVLVLPAGAALAVAETEPGEEPQAEAAGAPAAPQAEGDASAAAATPQAEGDASAAAATPQAEGDASTAAAEGRVARSTFTTGVVDREPRDSVRQVSNEQRELAYFTELRGLEGHTVVHRWQYGDQVMAEVSFEVGGPRWRVHSTKELDPAWVGTWTVSVVADGEVLTREEFEYTPAQAAQAPRSSDAPEPAPARSAEPPTE